MKICLSIRERLLRFRKSFGIAGVALVLSASLSAAAIGELLRFLDPSGITATMNTAGDLDLSNPFFQSLGTNGRACVTCHQPGDNWTVTPSHIQQRFLVSGGTDPIFRPVDGAICPSADVSSVAARVSAYSLLLNKGLIRISLNVPATADFAITAIDDPYLCPETTPGSPALYRRPLPSANLPFLTTVMWDGRESPKPAGRPLNAQDVLADLATQAADATTGHAQAVQPPTPQQLQQIVAFESSLFTAQEVDFAAGNLTTAGAQGGPKALSAQSFAFGMNDVLSPGFNPAAMTLFDSFSKPSGNAAADAARQSILRGQAIFNTHPITITGVAGLNDLPGLGTVNGTCTTCHDSPNVGNHSLPLPINIGIADASRRTPDLPLYTISCNDGQVKQVTDLGRAMITGKCADIGKFKGPILRGLAARAPYFHNGSAATFSDVVDFYVQRFGLSLTPQEKQDLIAFLNSL